MMQCPSKKTILILILVCYLLGHNISAALYSLQRHTGYP